MSTHTFDVIYWAERFIGGPENDQYVTTDATTGTFELVVADATKSFEYDILPSSDPDDLADADLTLLNIYDTRLIAGSTRLDRNDLDLQAGIGFVEWGSGNVTSTYLISNETVTDQIPAINSETFRIAFTLGGDPLPMVSSPDDMDAFLESITDVGAITSGQFGPGRAIPFSSIASLSSTTENDRFDGTNAEDSYSLGAGNDSVAGLGGADTMNGGAGTDTARYLSVRADYDVSETASGRVMVIGGSDGGDLLSNFERIEFTDGTFELNDLVRNRYINTSELGDDPAALFAELRDFDGNALGATEGWKQLPQSGRADVQNDGDDEFIFVNPTLGRWATLGPDGNGNIDLDDYGQGGQTRVVGVYLDPLVEAGLVVQGSDTDSARRFANDLSIDNLVLLDGGDNDYDGDGLQQMYFKTGDGTAYLHALMHADGNIQYANYQSEDQMIDYLTGLGFDSSTYGSWLDVG